MSASLTAVGIGSLVLVVGTGLRRKLAPPARRPPIDDVAVEARRRRRRSRLGRPLIRLAIAGLVILAAGPTLAALALVGRWSWPTLRRLAARRRRLARIDAAVPDAIELLVLLLHAGLTPHQAVDEMRRVAPAPIVPGFDAVGERLVRGSGLAESLGALTEVLGPQLASVADTLAISIRHGTPIAGVLDQLSHDARLRRRRAAEAEARKLPVRLAFPLVFCTLPSFVLVAIAPAVLAALSSLGDTPW